jgi:diadenosine tetraphosphatase ApaH/serine/threonine PP2A family protein phosphatase
MLAILYDIHGNQPALDAVIEDAEAAGADRWLLGGDFAAFGAWPAACVERLRGLGTATFIRGNWERWQAHPDEAVDNPVVVTANAAVRAALGGDVIDWGDALPATAELDGTLFCHASPGSDMVPVPRVADEDTDAELFAGVEVERVVFGHTHAQFTRRSADGEHELVNPGSVGLSWDGDTRAGYALLGDGIELRRVEYDLEAAAGALDGIGELWSMFTAARLRQARFDITPR